MGDFFREAGYALLTPDWPADPETVEEAKANPEVLAGNEARWAGAPEPGGEI